MHAAASGEEIGENTEIERVHDEIWDLNNDLNQMIYDIRKLNDEAANEKIQKEQIYSRQKDVEFKMLATQINPHFLYNTLENIRMLALINKQPEIEDISVTLTRLLRRSLNVSHELVTLKWEMEMVEYYIRIQNYRFGDRIRAEISYDKNMASKFMIIPLVVQPFVENAYVHAMEDKEADGLIKVRAEISDDMILYIEDNGHGMDEETLHEITRYINDFDNLDRTHIGICNVNQRIKLKFGDKYGVDFDSTKDVGTKVKITMPLIPK
jgi:two-component system sensor histidine kinase YesM